MKTKLYALLTFAMLVSPMCFSQTIVKNMSSANSDVYTVYKSGGSYYLGGAFTYVGLNTGYAALTTATKDYPNMDFPATNGSVYVVIPDASGGWYIGGNFTLLNSTSKSYLAHIKSDKTVDAAFNANCNSTVRALCLVGTKLYVGGSFTTINGTTRMYAGAVSASTGAVTSWNPALDNTVNAITAVLGTDTTIWLGGNFANVNTNMLRPYLVKVNNTNGMLINGSLNANYLVYALTSKKDSVFVGGAFNELGLRTNYLSTINSGSKTANQTIPYTNGVVRSIIPDGSGGWYVAGDFTQIGGITRTYIARVLSTNKVDATFNVALNGSVYAMAKVGTKLYIGGYFGTVNGAPRTYLAAVSASNGQTLSWAPSPNNVVRTLAVKDTAIIAGGDFYNVNGRNAYRIAALSQTSGNLLNGFVGYNSTVYKVSVKADSILTAGSYSLSAYYSPNSAKISTTNVVPDQGFPATNGYIRTVVPDGSGGYYVGGNFTQIGGINQPYIAHINSSNQVVTAWAPVLNGEVRTMLLLGTTLYIGGNFTQCNTVSRMHMSAISTANPGANKTWNSNLDAQVNSVVSDSTSIYAGGYFTTVNTSTTRHYLAKFDLTGKLDVTWDPDAGNEVEQLALSGSNILAGGAFATIKGVSRNHLAKLNNTNGGAVNWATAGSTVNALYVDGAICYVGGSFTTLTSTTRYYLGAINISNGAITAFNPNPSSTVLSISKSGSIVYYGGYFQSVNGTSRGYVAASSTSGTLQSWNPVANSTVTAINIDPSKNTVFLGGSFTGFKETGRSYASIIKYSTGMYAPWVPSINSTVYDATFGTNLMYLGGSFTTVDGATRNGLAAYSFGGKLQSFNLNLTKTGGSVTVNSLLLNSTTLYAGGDFTAAGSSARRDFVAANSSTGAVSTTDASPDASVYAIAVNGSTIAYGGAFTYSNITPRNYIGIVNSKLSTVAAWSPVPDNYVYDIAYNYNKIFIAGQFQNINGSARACAAAFALNGSLTAWNPQLTRFGSAGNVTVYGVAADSNNVYLGGYFDKTQGTTRNNASAVAATNAALLPWDPEPNNLTRTIGLKGSNIAFGGDFQFCKGAARNYVAKIDSATGLVNTGWNPGTNGYVWSITGNGNTIFIGGNYSMLGATTRNSLGSVNASTGAVTTFDPVVQTNGYAGTVNALAVDPSTSVLYVGGSFNSVKATTRNNLAALTTSGSGALQTWNPNATGGGNTVQALAINGASIYVGGSFTTLNGSTTRNYLASVNNTNGNVTAFNPNLNGYVYCLWIGSGILYAGGSFYTVNVSTSRPYLAAFDAATGNLKSWNPSAGSTVRGIAASHDTVYMGGSFQTLNGSTRNRIGAVRGAAGTTLLPFDPNADSYVYSNFVSGHVLLTGGSFGTISGLTRRGFAVYTLPGFALNQTNAAPDYSALMNQPALNNFNVYPNPAGNGTVRLTFNKAITGKVTVSIRSQSGEKVFEQSFESYTNNTIRLNMPGLTNGTYIINLTSNGTNESGKLVIAK